MPQKKRNLDRDGGQLRDSSLIIIASEDTHAVEQYFGKFSSSRVQVKVLNTQDGRSSPQGVITRLNEYHSNLATEPNDSFWVCLDKDRWASESNMTGLTLVLRECNSRGFEFLMCNPCFELWLLLHYVDVHGQNLNCGHVEKLLRTAAGGYNKKNVSRLEINMQSVEAATQRAKKLDSSKLKIPEVMSCQVFRIIEAMRDRGIVRIRD